MSAVQLRLFMTKKTVADAELVISLTRYLYRKQRQPWTNAVYKLLGYCAIIIVRFSICVNGFVIKQYVNLHFSV